MNTDQIFIRPCLAQDARGHHKAISESRGNTGQFLQWAREAQTWNFQQSVNWFHTYTHPAPGYSPHSIFVGNRFSGIITYTPAYDMFGTQICYWVTKPLQGKGLGTEALDFMTEKAFTMEGFDYVELHIDNDNLPSQKIAAKCGFEPSQEYTCEATGGKESGHMTVWIKTNPRGQFPEGCKSEAFQNREYLYPAYFQAADMMRHLFMLTDAITALSK